MGNTDSLMEVAFGVGFEPYHVDHDWKHGTLDQWAGGIIQKAVEVTDPGKPVAALGFSFGAVASTVAFSRMRGMPNGPRPAGLALAGMSPVYSDTYPIFKRMYPNGVRKWRTGNPHVTEGFGLPLPDIGDMHAQVYTGSKEVPTIQLQAEFALGTWRNAIHVSVEDAVHRDLLRKPYLDTFAAHLGSLLHSEMLVYSGVYQ